jgi:hypothetical protein
MKKIFTLLFIVCSQPIWGQVPDSGTWIVKEKKIIDSLSHFFVYADTSVLFLSDTSFAPIFNDSILDQYTYLRAPHIIHFSQYKLILVYGDIMNPEDRVVAKERTLTTQKGDCIFSWEPSTSMYEYVVTWNNDHFVYYTNGGMEYHYELIDMDVLSQQQKEKLVPKDETWIYFQGRLRPVENHYHCNITAKK